MKDIAVVVSNDNACNIYETLEGVIKAGFKNVFIQWYDKDWNPSQEEQLKLIKEKGLNVLFAHLGYQNINDIWLDNEEGEKLVDRYKNDIKNISDNNIPMVCMHITSKSEAPMYNELGLRRLREIVDYAKKLNVKVAFENTKIKGYLEYVLENIDSDNAGLCFDSGHYHAHFNDELDFSKFKGRIFCVHLHDNDGTSDQHLLPFDGTLDWDKVIKDLKDNNYNGPITMELCYRNKYEEMSVEDFYKKGYELGLKLSELFDK